MVFSALPDRIELFWVTMWSSVVGTFSTVCKSCFDKAIIGEKSLQKCESRKIGKTYLPVDPDRALTFSPTLCIPAAITELAMLPALFKLPIMSDEDLVGILTASLLESSWACLLV